MTRRKTVAGSIKLRRKLRPVSVWLSFALVIGCLLLLTGPASGQEPLFVNDIPANILVNPSPPDFRAPFNGGQDLCLSTISTQAVCPTSFQSFNGGQSSPNFIWPTYGVITQPYGNGHTGVDIGNIMGTPIVAARDGQVIFSNWDGGYGNHIKIAHSDGKITTYGHLYSYAAFPGQSVRQGQIIGYMGTTGNSTGPHLHFEILVNGSYTNPLLYLPTQGNGGGR